MRKLTCVQAHKESRESAAVFSRCPSKQLCSAAPDKAPFQTVPFCIACWILRCSCCAEQADEEPTCTDAPGQSRDAAAAFSRDPSQLVVAAALGKAPCQTLLLAQAGVDMCCRLVQG